MSDSSRSALRFSTSAPVPLPLPLPIAPAADAAAGNVVGVVVPHETADEPGGRFVIEEMR